jgi:tetratricopeptide (TPR) repeat protein
MLVLSLFLFASLTADSTATTSPADWPRLRSAALEAQRRGDSRAAEQLFRRALALSRNTSPGEYFISLEDLGTHFWQLDNARAAEPYFRAAVELMEHAVAPHSRSRPVALNNLATALRFMGAYSEAQTLQLRALREFQALGAMLDVARCYAGLAEISVAAADFGRAASELKTAADLLDHSGDSVDVGSTRVWLAQNYLVLNRPPEAALQIDRARPALEGRLPVDDSRMLTFNDTRGAVLFHRGRYAEAERIWTRALATAGSGTPVTAMRIHLAQLYSTLGDYPRAAVRFTEVLQKQNPSGLARGVLESELGWALLSGGQPQRAEPLFHAAMTDLEGAGLGNSTPAATLCARYARLYTTQGDWGSALPLLQRAIIIGRNTAYPKTAQWMLERAQLYRKLGNKKAASESRKEAEALFQSEPKSTRDTVDVRELEAAKRQP